MRNRDHMILFRLNNQEHEHLKKQVERNGLSMAAYLRAILSGQKVRLAPTEESIMLYRLLSSMSNNINQLTMLAHIHGSVSQADIRKIEAFRKELWQVSRAVLDGERGFSGYSLTFLAQEAIIKATKQITEFGKLGP